MLVADSHRRSDPRVLYGILAESALEQLKAEPPEEAQRRAYFQNLIRLLEMYRFDSLRRPSPRAVLDRRQTDVKGREMERNANTAVERALDVARAAIYEGVTRAQMVEHMKNVLTNVMDNDLGDVTPNDVRKVARFLKAFAAALRP